jgi:hypothetical protein
MTRVVRLLVVLWPLLALACNGTGGDAGSTYRRSDAQQKQREWNDRARKEFKYVTRELEKHSQGNR